MNLVLIYPDELDGDVATIKGRRAVHILSQLGKTVGTDVRVGVLGQSVGNARLRAVRDDPAELVLELLTRVPASAPTLSLVLAVPRPKALSRVLQHAAAFGLARIDLVRTARVERSYLDSKRLTPERIEEDLLLGLEQGRLVHLPAVRVFFGLSELLEALAPSSEDARLLFHPGAQDSPLDALKAAASSQRWVAALGPDGGLQEHELQAFRRARFQLVTLGASVLRTEAAVSAALGQLNLCRRILTQRA